MKLDDLSEKKSATPGNEAKLNLLQGRRMAKQIGLTEKIVSAPSTVEFEQESIIPFSHKNMESKLETKSIFDRKEKNRNPKGTRKIFRLTLSPQRAEQEQQTLESLRRAESGERSEMWLNQESFEPEQSLREIHSEKNVGVTGGKHLKSATLAKMLESTDKEKFVETQNDDNEKTFKEKTVNKDDRKQSNKKTIETHLESEESMERINTSAANHRLQDSSKTKKSKKAKETKGQREAIGTSTERPVALFNNKQHRSPRKDENIAKKETMSNHVEKLIIKNPDKKSLTDFGAQEHVKEHSDTPKIERNLPDDEGSPDEEDSADKKEERNEIQLNKIPNIEVPSMKER